MSRAAGLEIDPDLVVYADAFREDEGTEAFRELLRRDTGMTAVVAGNDLIALGCYNGLHEHGLTVGVDISVVGFNDMLFAGKLCPPLTTVRIPQYEIGMRAAQMVLDVVLDRTTETVNLLLPPELVRRASTGPPSGDR